MPLCFLTEDQRDRYARFAGEPSPEQLARYFYLDERDQRIVNRHRGDHSRLGFATQLCTARFLEPSWTTSRKFLPVSSLISLGNSTSTSSAAFSFISKAKTRWDHAAEIRDHCGSREFSEASIQFRRNRWLYALCWTGIDRPGMIFDRATSWLIASKVLLPAVTTLERHVAKLRSRVDDRLLAMIGADLTPEAKQKLESLLSDSQRGHQSLLDKLRKGLFRRSAPELVRALERIEEVRNLEIDVALSQRIPPARLQGLARFANTAKAANIQRLPEARRIATLAAFASNLEAAASDDALDLLDILITEVFASAAQGKAAID